MKVSCIIPAHNEEKSIANTIKVVLAAGDIIHEIIVIDDCSKDKTNAIVKTFSSIKLITNEKNLGKSGSVAKGIRESTGDYLLFLDADLVGLHVNNIISLINPIGKNKADITISFRGNTPKWWKALVGVEIISGDRVFAKGMIIDYVQEIEKLPSFGLEVFLNKIIIKQKLKVCSVFMGDVKNDFSWNKRGLWGGVKKEFFMWRNIFKVISIQEFVYQNIKIKSLLISNQEEK